MKTIQYTLLILLSTFALGSCVSVDDPSPANGSYDASKTAKITGRVLAAITANNNYPDNLGTIIDNRTVGGVFTDPINPTAVDDPVSDLKLLVIVKATELINGATNSTPALVFTTTTDANGEYEIDVPATDDGIRVSIAVTEIKLDATTALDDKVLPDPAPAVDVAKLKAPLKTEAYEYYLSSNITNITIRANTETIQQIALNRLKYN